MISHRSRKTAGILLGAFSTVLYGGISLLLFLTIHDLATWTIPGAKIYFAPAITTPKYC